MPMSASAFYEIRLQGELGPQWAESFDPLAMMTPVSGETLLAGALPDQAALHGILARVRDLGLVLLSVMRVENGESASFPWT